MRSGFVAAGFGLLGLIVGVSTTWAQDLGGDNRFDAAPFALPVDNGDTSPCLRWGRCSMSAAGGRRLTKAAW